MQTPISPNPQAYTFFPPFLLSGMRIMSQKYVSVSYWEGFPSREAVRLVQNTALYTSRYPSFGLGSDVLLGGGRPQLDSLLVQDVFESKEEGGRQDALGHLGTDA